MARKLAFWRRRKAAGEAGYPEQRGRGQTERAASTLQFPLKPRRALSRVLRRDRKHEAVPQYSFNAAGNVAHERYLAASRKAEREYQLGQVMDHCHSSGGTATRDNDFEAVELASYAAAERSAATSGAVFKRTRDARKDSACEGAGAQSCSSAPSGMVHRRASKGAGLAARGYADEPAPFPARGGATCGALICRCGARTLVLLSSLFVLLFGAGAIALGACALTMKGFLVNLVPNEIAWGCIGAGVLMVALSVISFWGACDEPRVSRGRLACNALLTLLLMGVALSATVLLFVCASYMRAAQSTHFSKDDLSKPEALFYDALRNSFERIYDWCAPSAYLNDDVNAACAAGAPGDACAGNSPGMLGLFCKEPAEIQRSSLEEALYNPPAEVLGVSSSSEAAAESDLDFDWWMSTYCMPSAPEFFAGLRYVEDALSWQPDDAAAPPAEYSSADGGAEEYEWGERFVACYTSNWWVPDAFPEPGGPFPPSDSLPAAVVGPLGAGEPINAKVTFCFCAARDAELLTLLVEFLEASRRLHVARMINRDSCA